MQPEQTIGQLVHHAGATKNQDQAEAYHEGRRDDGQHRQQAQGAARRKVAARDDQREAKPEQRCRRCGRCCKYERIPKDAAICRGGNASKPPDLAIKQPRRHGIRHTKITLRREDLREDGGDRPGSEDHDAGNQHADRAGDEAIALEIAAQRQAIGQQYQKADEAKRATKSNAELPILQFAKGRFKKGIIPTLNADREALGDNG